MRKICASLPKRSFSRRAVCSRISIAAGIADAGMNGLEAVQVEQRQLRLLRAIAPSAVMRVHQRGARAQPGQRIVGDAGALSLRSVMSLRRPRQSDGTSWSVTMVARSSSQRHSPARRPGRGIPAGRPGRADRGTVPARRDRSSRSSGCSCAIQSECDRVASCAGKSQHRGRFRRQASEAGRGNPDRTRPDAPRRSPPAPDWRTARTGSSAFFRRALRFQQAARRWSRAGTAAPRFLRWRSPPAPAGSRPPRQSRRWWRARSSVSPKPPRLVTAAASATSAKAAALGAITCAACMPRRPQRNR